MTQNPNDSQRIKELEQKLRYAQIEVAYLKGLRRLEKNALMNKKSRLIYSLRKTFKLKEILKVTGFPKATYYYWVNCFERVNKDELIEK
ncbi:transposase (plasmid) [Lactococcus cremoris]|nr:transposase [Lactococcus cremoris]